VAHLVASVLLRTLKARSKSQFLSARRLTALARVLSKL